MKPHPGFSFLFCSEKTPYCSSAGGKQPARARKRFPAKVYTSTSCCLCVCHVNTLPHDVPYNNTEDLIIISETYRMKICWLTERRRHHPLSLPLCPSVWVHPQHEDTMKWKNAWKPVYSVFTVWRSSDDVWQRILPAVSYRLSFISFPPTVTVVTYFSNTDGAYFCFWDT